MTDRLRTVGVAGAGAVGDGHEMGLEVNACGPGGVHAGRCPGKAMIGGGEEAEGGGVTERADVVDKIAVGALA